ncbi:MULTISPECIES: ABC transporter ATP-binding protein [Aminobacter]|jgi:oligopeptide/dipeptide ABC transporter ATP-binding protein|uniref:Oligopeptide/dipeptide ABC transporter ATP-binding protein n=2 Tax=Aminobacter TaxID=31988 RepID=A0AAC9AT41_AMIAI|nr:MULTISPECIES: ABC transporter ATP-binding protein [Aminobacter]AMS44775.1 Peptide ABC transporter ATPase [Aminobacter aminovorans]MBA8908115.1 oligopeptide/dipeptide ABC transporter ATP-binding protein [Aminobacter ciceronei]MBA9021901.1 oligopeptide/dipeptide ABC transporter ATP-binding protein [Aminobacter ciceronei]MBB3704430.1 oligopeptide/dipeptide ABC transporter ATP-binding protein [Aminobacter aminovorans]MRX32331.1 ATP-binding cassette domain-containing protein [Aminobacter sp. MDW
MNAISTPMDALRPAPVLEVSDLRVSYGSASRPIHVVNDVSFAVGRGEALGIVGESGCGKSQTMLAVLGLLPSSGRISAGKVTFEGQDLARLSARQLRGLRGKGMALISQDALSALNPSMTIGTQMAEPMIHYDGMSRAAARERCIELLDLVGIPGAAARLGAYPHELSGGMRQRVLIATAISGNPKVLIADEPTTALDVTIQAQILRLIDRLRRDLGMALVIITHDLGVVAGVADQVAVMYAGRVVEAGSTDAIFSEPRHPYTRALLEAIPKLDEPADKRLTPIAGLPPDPRRAPAGCAFHPRCRLVQPLCREQLPALEAKDAGAGHLIRCSVDPWARTATPEARGVSASGALS